MRIERYILVEGYDRDDLNDKLTKMLESHRWQPFGSPIMTDEQNDFKYLQAMVSEQTEWEGWEDEL